MSVARARALTPIGLIGLSVAIGVEMSVARARALTHFSASLSSYFLLRRNECCPCEGIDTGRLPGHMTRNQICRNECCPCEGIDTRLSLDRSLTFSSVEMSVARARALTPVCIVAPGRRYLVEMSVARARALTRCQYSRCHTRISK